MGNTVDALGLIHVCVFFPSKWGFYVEPFHYNVLLLSGDKRHPLEGIFETGGVCVNSMDADPQYGVNYGSGSDPSRQCRTRIHI